MYILPPSIPKRIEGYRWQSFTPPAAGKSRRFRGLICHRRSQAADRDRIRAGWQNLKGYNGVSGDTTMNDVGDGSGATAILKVMGGKYVNIMKQ